jgi:large conductance mechanosensitive channel
MGFGNDFKAFALRGNVVDMAVGIIIGGAFGTIVKSLVEDVIMPPVGMLVGNVDFADKFVVLRQGAAGGPDPTVEAAKEAGAVTLNYGNFITNIASFLIVAFAVFLLVRAMMRLQHPEPVKPAENKTCQYCQSSIPIKAVRCPNCTSQLAA